MKIKFGNYTYFDPNDKDQNEYIVDKNKIKDYEKYVFNQDTLDNFVANREYSKAIDYAKKFVMHDIDKQKQLNNYIANLESDGRKLEAIYSRITNDDDKEKLQFINNVFVGGGLDKIRDNKYTKEYTDFLDKFGSSYAIEQSSDGSWQSNIKEKATKLSVTFYPEKQYGMFGWDWTAADNQYNIENFYRTSGLTKEQLDAKGVIISEKDGKTTLTFDKSNDLANKILLNVQHERYNTDSGIPAISIGDYHAYDPKIVGLNDKGEEITVANTSDLQKMQDQIRYLNNRKTELFSTINTTKQYSSTVCGYLDDRINKLQNALETKQITFSEYNSEFKRLFPELESAIAGSGFSQLEMYSNDNNEDYTDQTLRAIDVDDRVSIQNRLTANLDKLKFNVYTSNGLIGTLITIPATEKTGKEAPKDVNVKSEEYLNSKQVQVFIPNFMPGQEQAAINKNTSYKAIREINDMQDWGYDYPLYDGSKLKVDKNGTFWKDNEPVNKEKATREINKTMIIEESKRDLQYKYTNKNGKIFDTKSYENLAKLIAINSVNEFYPNINILENDSYDITQKDIDAIFDKKGAGANVLEKFAENMNKPTYDKYVELFEIYDRIMQGITYYDEK